MALETSSGSIEVFPWLKTLPVAPEFHPTLAEFEDPISYIFKIEEEASKYGICKIVPPVPPPSKKTTMANLNKSLSARSGSNGPTFTTRQQQIGFCPRKHRPVQKSVWQSGERYSVQQFESKAKVFEGNYLKKGSKKGLTAVEAETLYWKAMADKPFSVEYANDMPGSAFPPIGARKGFGGLEGMTLGETAWNMRGIAREKGSLLKFMKEDIPGVTSPMVYIAMMFSWFAWHVEDHDLHSLNYLHMGAGKTWYGVPRDAALAFEEVIRMHGYGGEINPLVTFATLGEKTTVMSPEVLINAGIPCCRLVQNAGEFVVTFPRAYHSGFSHGFNCGEASNIATPEWLKFAREAAIRRASINCPPMVSHFQLLYDLALSLCSSVSRDICFEPRSSRLKDKKKGKGETLVKDLFVQDLIQNNILLDILAQGSSVVLLPRNFSGNTSFAKSQAEARLKGISWSFPDAVCPDLEGKHRKNLVADSIVIDRNQGFRQAREVCSTKGKYPPLSDRNQSQVSGGSDDIFSHSSLTRNVDPERERSSQCDRSSDQGLFSCVTCGILCYTTVAIVKPTDAAARYLMSDCGTISRRETTSDDFTAVLGDAHTSTLDSRSGQIIKGNPDGLFDVPVQSVDQVHTPDDNAEVVPNVEMSKHTSLGLLALNYGNSSDSEDSEVGTDVPVEAYESNSGNCSPGIGFTTHDAMSLHVPSYGDDIRRNVDTTVELNTVHDFRHEIRSHSSASVHPPVSQKVETTAISTAQKPFQNASLSFETLSDEDSSRMHVFCLQHAVQVEQQLRSYGGVQITVLCHPDYPELEAQARKISEELGNDYSWSDISFRESVDKDERMIQLALASEEALHGNGDWSVKLGINLYHSVVLSRSPLYSKQLPYNAILYSSFGRSNTLENSDFSGKGSGRQKKLVVAGKWCGKVWMSNQVHPLLADRSSEEQEEERGVPSFIKPEAKLAGPSEAKQSNEASVVNCYERKRKNAAESKSNETAAMNLRTGRKRKNGSESKPTMKSRSLKVEDTEEESDASPVNLSRQRPKTNPKNKRMKKETVDSKSSSEKSKKKFDSSIEEKLGDFGEDSEGSPANISSRRCKTNLKNKRVRKETVDLESTCGRSKKKSDSLIGEEPGDTEEDSDGSSANISLQRCKTNLKNKRGRKEAVETKSTSGRSKKKSDSLAEEELGDTEEDSDGSSANISRQRCKTNLRNKRGKKETVDPKSICIRRNKKPDSLIEEDVEDTVEDSESSLANISRRQCKANLKNKRAKKDTVDQENIHERSNIKFDSLIEEELEGGPSTRLRRRTSKLTKDSNINKANSEVKKKPDIKKGKKETAARKRNAKEKVEEKEFPCDIEGCIMSFSSKQELTLHKKNICPVKGCQKKFFSHKYLVQHRRVHMEERPLSCPWKGCRMTFKWAWARTEHIRVHTGDRPYVCTEDGCGQTFRFVSDFSRHKRKTGHHSSKRGRG